MENRKFFKDVSASGIQVIVNQISNIIIFYLISKYISKEYFGFYNWGTAVLSISFTVLSLGMDMIYVNRIAINQQPYITRYTHFYHTFLSSLLFLSTTLILNNFLPFKADFKIIFILILINQIALSVSNSVKLYVNGKEEYSSLAKISILSNCIKIGSILILLLSGNFTINLIILIFIISYLIELVSYLYISKKISNDDSEKLSFKEYFLLIKESFPQLGVVIFDSANARVDWILMGILSTTVKTAEYTFAFKFFELSKIPLAIISPILLTRFSKIFKQSNNIEGQLINKIDSLFKLELFISIFIPLISIILWTDLIDYLTNNKYGEVNQITYIILALCIPLHYVINFLWNIAFAQKQLKSILIVISITTISNITLNILLIPIFHGNGAAISFLLSTVIQLIIYCKLVNQKRYKVKLKPILSSLICGLFALLLAKVINYNLILQTVIAFVTYIFLAYITGIFEVNKLKTILKR